MTVTRISGTASDQTVSAGDTLEVLPGGTTLFTNVLEGGTQLIDAGGLASGADVQAGGAEVVFVQLKSTQLAAWLNSIAVEHENIRAALAWCEEHAEPELGLRAARPT